MAPSRLIPGSIDWHHEVLGLRQERGIDEGTQAIGRDLAWFNERGEYLSFGDLSGDHCQRLAAELLPGEMLVVLYPSEGNWHFQSCAGVDCKYGLHYKQTPGWEYLSDHAAFIILPGRLVYSSDLHREAGAITIGGVEWEEMPKRDAKVFLLEQFEAARLFAQRDLPKAQRHVFGKLHDRHGLQTPVRAFPWTQLDIKNRYKGQLGIRPFYVHGLRLADVFCGQFLRLGLVGDEVVEVAVNQGGSYKVVFPAPPA